MMNHFRGKLKSIEKKQQQNVMTFDNIMDTRNCMPFTKPCIRLLIFQENLSTFNFFLNGYWLSIQNSYSIVSFFQPCMFSICPIELSEFSEF